MGTWIVWLIVAAVLGVVEIVTTRLAFGLMAVAALVGAAVGAAGDDEHGGHRAYLNGGFRTPQSRAASRSFRDNRTGVNPLCAHAGWREGRRAC